MILCRAKNKGIKVERQTIYVKPFPINRLICSCRCNKASSSFNNHQPQCAVLNAIICKTINPKPQPLLPLDDQVEPLAKKEREKEEEKQTENRKQTQNIKWYP
jgi:hypothetical protein